VNASDVIAQARRRAAGGGRHPCRPLDDANLYRVGGRRSRLEDLNTPEERSHNQRLLSLCAAYWENLRGARDRRARVRNFLNGEQWGDRTREGYTEISLIERDGNYPAKYNIMLPILNNILGQYRSMQKKSIVLIRKKDSAESEQVLTNALQAVQDLNLTAELDARLVAERWMSGLVAQRITFDWWAERDQSDVLVENCETTRVFFNTDVRDPRLLDMHTCGMLYDYDLEQLVADADICRSQEDADYLRSIYQGGRRLDAQAPDNLMSAAAQDAIDFYSPVSHGKCRVIEVWYREVERRMYLVDSATGQEYITNHTVAEVKELNWQREADVAQKNEVIAQYNAQRPEAPAPFFELNPIEYEERYEEVTYFKKISPLGYTLQKGESPFWHQGTPFVFEIRPLTDGDVCGEGYQLIDIQKQYNRFRLLMDIAIKHGIKGVILIPGNAIPYGWTASRYVRELKKIDGYVVYKVDPKMPHAKPEQLSNSVSIQSMLQTMSQEMKQMMLDVAGTSTALMGRQPSSGTPASLYREESGNAAMNALDFFSSFASFAKRRDTKILKLIQQFYAGTRSIVTAGMSGNDVFEYQSEKLADVDTDVQVVNASSSPMAKEDQEADLRQMVLQQMIPVELWLKNSTAPYAKTLLKDFDEMRQQAQQAPPQAQQAPPQA
jgi:hypothetical protein